MEISATLSKEGAPEVTVNYEFGNSADETIKLFTKELVVKRAIAGWVVDLQGVLRRYITKCMDEGKQPNQKDLDEIAAKWAPTEGPKRKSKQDKVKDLLGGMSAEERAALLKELKAA